jgi:hypothetical protein
VCVGLHFPGPDIFKYATVTTGASHNQVDVWIWASVNMLVWVALPLIYLRFGPSSFSMKKLLSSLQWKRDLWIIVIYWAFDFFGPIAFAADDDFLKLSALQYFVGIPLGIFFNTLGAGLPVVVMMNIIFLPNVAALCPKTMGAWTKNLTTIALSGFFYAVFSLFDQGVGYTSAGESFMSVTYIIMTQTVVGMGKAGFTVVTGNPFIHYITLHVISARVPFDTKMFCTIFGLE